MLSVFHTLEFKGDFEGRSYLLEIHDVNQLKEQIDQDQMDTREDEEVGEAQESCLFRKMFTSEGIQMPFTFEAAPGSYRVYVAPYVNGEADNDSEFFCNYRIGEEPGRHIKFVIDRIMDVDGAEEGISATHVGEGADNGVGSEGVFR